MEGFAKIGTLYYLNYNGESYIWMVVENNKNNKTTTLQIIDECEETGRRIKVSAEKLNQIFPMGPILEPSGDIVIENGIEFIKKKEKQYRK